MKRAKEITKRSTLLATIRSEFPKSTAIDLEKELYEMINKALMLGGVVERSEQLKAFAEYLDDLHGGEPFAVNEIDGYLKSL